ncbi:zinc-dependent alcohol dehydrogenase [Halocatena marina]|uniref:Zinc-binding dehydrogenase n=1 Tax=Halocatena marina TaxID=2934937 RepID=A0ABD5YXU6_9EURY|nr:alcohol dehydrogenase catalytic domain-containing protein [Halocatena marina]
MKQIVQTGARSVEVQESDQPKPGPDEVLVRVHSAGICGSDAHAYKYDGGYDWIQIPRVMGHEYSGRVEEVGSNVTTFGPGDKVVEEPIHHCGECLQCKRGEENVCENFSITGMHRDGAYADYVTVGHEHLHAVPDSVSLQEAAITEPTSIATRAVLTQSDLTPGDDVLVEGPGPIGVLTAVIADSVGANVIVSGLSHDVQSRFPTLKRLGIDTIDIETNSLENAVAERTNRVGFDVVFDATGHHSGIKTATENVRKGGQVVIVGIPNEPSDVLLSPVVRGEVDINSSYGSKWADFEKALQLMENDTIDAEAIIDTSFSRDDPKSAFEAFLDSQVIKPVFTFSEE